MAERREAEPVAFFVGVLAADADCLETARRLLEREFGPVGDAMAAMRFGFTAYYQEELGESPLRAFYSFGTDFPPDGLACAKILSNRLEEEAAGLIGPPLPRPVNLDPGYLAPDKLVLASAKNFAHRIYLSKGVYAEVTLQYRDRAFRTLPWTFPDYASGEYDDFFLRLRARLMESRRRGS